MLKRNANLIIKLLLLITLIILLLFISGSADNIAIEPEIKGSPMPTNIVTPEVSSRELKDSPLLFKELDYAVYHGPTGTKELLVNIQKSINALETLNKEEYTLEAAKLMHEELARLKKLESRIASDLAHYLNWEKEHYWAAKVWECLRQRGYSSAVTSAIIGNMMIETSGGSLNLKPIIYDPAKEYYGLCQWSLEYYPETKDLSFEHQLDFLLETMPWEFNTFGWLYKEGFDYEDFLVMTDPAEAAFAFAKVYERCAPTSYTLRQQAAIKAHNYFDLEAPLPYGAFSIFYCIIY